jgi:prolyl-tRNA synthetase
VKFADKEGKLDHVWATSWGVSTRLMGALIMTHSDDEGLVLPPKLAPIQVVIVPIHKTDEELVAISEKVSELTTNLKALGISFKYDDDENRRPGWKFAEYETKGVPVRIAIGPRDLANGQVELTRRDTKEKSVVDFEGLDSYIEELLADIQDNLFERANQFRSENMHKVDTYAEFKEQIESKGGFFLVHWDGTAETEEKIKEETKATIRCIPLDAEEENGVCMVTGKPSKYRVVIAKAY